MINVLFVCLGNICRSPMAEAIFRHKVKQAKLEHKIHVDSVGTSAFHIGQRPHRGTHRELKRHNISSDGIAARQLSGQDIENSQYIIVMDTENLNDVRQQARRWGYNVDDARMMLEFSTNPQLGDLNVPDPYYTRGFDKVYNMLDDASDGLLKYIRKQEKL